MKKKLLFFILTLQFVAIKIFSQEVIKVPEFGKITSEALQMKDCEFEKGVPAMHLLKYEEITFSNPGNFYMIVTQKRVRTKIFNTNGFKYANIVIGYPGGDKDFKVSNIEAITYNVDDNGNIQASVLKSEDIYKNKGKKKRSMNSIAFTLPDIKAGSVIEYRYTITEKETRYIAPWYFQDDIPNLVASCKITMPQQSFLDKRLIGVDSVEEGFAIDNSKGYERLRNVKSYTLRNVPSFRSESFMSSPNDYKKKIVFNLDPFETEYEATLRKTNGGWDKLNIQMLGSSLGWYFKAPIIGTEKFIDSTRKLNSISEKVNAVYTFVKTRVKWNEYYDISPGNPQAIWDKKEGTSSDVNEIILNLLRKVDVDCYPLLFSTRSHGKTDNNFVSLSQFNSIDILVFDGDNFYILDGTSKYLPYNVPPYNIMFRDVFIIDPKYSKWVKITDDRQLLKDSVSVIASIKDDGMLTGKTVHTFYDLSKALEAEYLDEKNINNENDDDNNNDDDDISNSSLIGSEIKTDSSFHINKDSSILPLIETTNFHYELPSTEEFYFLSPFLFSGLSKNPFTDSIRRSDVDFGSALSHKVHIEIAIPKNLNVEELMRNKTIRTADSSIAFTCFTDYKNDTLYINSSFEVNDPIFYKEDYEMVRQFFKNVYILLNNQVLLKRKEEQ